MTYTSEHKCTQTKAKSFLDRYTDDEEKGFTLDDLRKEFKVRVYTRGNVKIWKAYCGDDSYIVVYDYDRYATFGYRDCLCQVDPVEPHNEQCGKKSWWIYDRYEERCEECGAVI